MRLGIRIPYWTDSVGTFDPRKVVEQVARAFPETVVDPTDHQAVRLERELAHFDGRPEPERSALIRQAWSNAQDNGPTFRFEIPTPAGSIRGVARRYCVSFDLPDGVDDDRRGRLEQFLRGLRLGEPVWDAQGAGRDAGDGRTDGGRQT